SLHAQAPDTLWTRCIGGASGESATAVFPTADGGFLIGGSTSSFGSSDFYMVKTNEQGEVVWEKTFGQTDRYEAMTCMIETDGGGYLMAGKRAEDSPYTSSSDIYLIKTDASGNVSWSSIIGEATKSETPASIAQTPDGGYIICGSYWLSSQTVFDVFLRKVNSEGIQQWMTYINFEDGSADYGDWIEVASDGGFLITGRTQAFNYNYAYDAYIMKTTGTGVEEWMIEYGDPWPYYEGANRLIKTSDGGFFICGYQNNDGVDNDWYVVKTNGLGVKQWSRTIGGTYHDKAFNACETSDGGYAVTGNYHLENWRCFVAKYNNEGDTLWTRMWGDANHSSHNYDIRQLDDGGFITLGTITPNGGLTDIYLSRLSEDITGIENPDGKINPSQIEFLDAKPNPFSNSTLITYRVNSRRHLNISIYNLIGTKLATLVEGIVAPGSYEVSIGENLPAGIYFCQLQSEEFCRVKKLIRTN
ncbi:MAG: T9SS type A sorting domain-containing protein, partial [Bacteroidales bacterium]|nr:T9SS type A sorting domain-containing protein [Bacteroidales bacterium]